jgi:thioredoxin-dependent peroxiredoxin
MSDHPAVGGLAPEFSLLSDTGETVRLADLRGRWVVLFFYPMDDTPVCTKEACAFRDAASQFAKVNAVLLGISADGLDSHRRFSAKYGLPYRLLSDPDGAVRKAYGVYRWLFRVLRSTFVIAPDGVIAAAFRGVRVNGHEAEVLAVLEPAQNKKIL